KCATKLRHVPAPQRGQPSLPHRRRGTWVRGQGLRPRFSRTRTEIRTGVPEKPNSSRSLRSRKRRCPASRTRLVNSTNVGGRALAWVANRIFGCFPPRTGGGVAAITSESH